MSIYDVEIKDWTELPDDLPDKCEGGWNFNRGGDGLPDNVWCIAYIDEDLISTRYRLPLFISHMMELQETWTKEEIQMKFKVLMGF